MERKILNTRKGKKMSYSELVKLIEENKHIKTKMDVVCWLVGYQGKVDSNDINNITVAYIDGFID